MEKAEKDSKNKQKYESENAPIYVILDNDLQELYKRKPEVALLAQLVREIKK